MDKFQSFLFRHKFLTYLLALALTYLLLSPVVISPLYDRLLFYPDHQYRHEIDGQLKKIEFQFKSQKQDVYIMLANGKKIHAWYFKKPLMKKTFLVSHGNGGNICYRLPLISTLLQYGSVFIYDYEGYGLSEGTPSRPAICNDGLAAYDFLNKDEHINANDIILYGESLGCGVSCEISKYRPVGALILQSPWASLLAAARDRLILPRLYPDWTFSEPHLDNVPFLSKPHPPVLLIHGLQDNILPCRYSQEIFAKACPPKQLVLLPHASHNNIGVVDVALYNQSILNFLKGL